MQQSFPLVDVSLQPIAKEALKVLAYFQIFGYPLREDEIWQNMAFKCTQNEVNASLGDLKEREILFVYDGFYLLEGDFSQVERRVEGNELAKKYLQRAQKIIRLLVAFPFIEGIYISGSLSKGYMDKEGDIDYFVVTKPGRLWFTKGALMLFKKIFLLNSKKYACFNYFVDSNNLEIPEKNIFTAKELKYLIPIYNDDLYETLLEKNAWVENHLPNFEHPWRGLAVQPSKQALKKSLEFICGGYLGKKLDDVSMKLFESFWRKKYQVRDKNDIRIKCHKHTSKIHPQNFQDKVLSGLQENITNLETKHKIRIAD